MDAIMQKVGTCIDVFSGVTQGDTICIFSGLTFPYKELDKIREKVEGSQEAVMRNLAATTEARLSGGINFLHGTQSAKPVPQNTDKDNPADVFAKYMKKS
jgi:hypothetical protein